MIHGIPPGLLLILGALLVPVLKGRVRSGWLLLLPLLSLAQTVGLDPADRCPVPVGEFSLELLAPDKLGLAFAYVFHLALFLGLLFSLHLERPAEQVSALVYAGATILAVLAGDLLSLFVAWEVVAVASAFVIWSHGTERAYRAGNRYLLWQVISGLLLLAGILVRYRALGPAGLAFREVGGIGLNGPGGTLILLGFGVKCAFPVLHTWLSDAYPEASPSGTVFLSAFTSKLAVYALARGFAGTEALIYVGAAMAAFPIFYAVIENDLRRVLAYSLINQVGFMVVGVGLGAGLGVDGAVAHACADVLFKGLLFMTMGAVLFRTGTIAANELGGLYKTMPFTAACCLVGAASISAFPGFSAFATKSIIMKAAAEQHYTGVWFVLLFAAAGVFHHAGIKIPFFAFFAHDSGKRPPEAPLHMKLAMGLAAACCVGIGCGGWQLLYSLLPYPLDWSPYDATHVVTQLQLLFFSALAFCALMLSGRYPPELTSVNLDADALWRAPARPLLAFLRGPASRWAGGLQELILTRAPAAVASAMGRFGPRGHVQAQEWAMGSSVVVMLVLLSLYLLLGR